MTDREAAKQALEAYDKHEPLAVVMEELRAALEQQADPVNPLDEKTIAALIEASGIELDDDHVLEDQTIYYVDASTLFGLVRKVEEMFQPRMSTSNPSSTGTIKHPLYPVGTPIFTDFILFP